MLIDVPPRQFHTPNVDWDKEGCPAYNHLYTVTVSDVTISLTMDCFNNQPLYGAPVSSSLYTPTTPHLLTAPPLTTASATAAPNHNVLFYIIQNKTKVPQTQTQRLNAFLKPDITGALGLSDGNKWTDSFVKPIKNVDSVYLNNNICIQSTPHSILFTESIQKHNSNVNVQSCNKEKENMTQHDSTKNVAQLQTLDYSDRILCTICFSKFERRIVFDEHYRTNHPDENITYTCSICRAQEKDFNNFRNHYYRHFKKGRLRCSFCPDFRFTQQEHCDAHIKIFHPKEGRQSIKQSKPEAVKYCHAPSVVTAEPEGPVNLFCSLCKVKFTEKSSYDDHYENTHHHYSVFYECSLCFRVFKTFKNFKNHTCTPKALVNSTEKQQPPVDVHQMIEVVSPVQNSTCTTLIGETSSTLSFNQIEILPELTSNEASLEPMDDGGVCVYVKDPTLAKGMKDNSDWDSTLNDFAYKDNNAVVDENQNSDKMVNKNNDLFTDIGDNCDLFENIRFSPNIFSNLLSGNLESADSQNNTENKKMDVVRDESNMTEYNKSESKSSDEDELPSEINGDFLASLISQDLFEFDENIPTRDLNKSFDIRDLTQRQTNIREPSGNLDAIRNNSEVVNNSLNAKQCQMNYIGSQISNRKMTNIGKVKPKIRSKEPYLSCYICEQNFTKKDALSEHMDTDHPPWHVVYKCRFCHFEDHNFQKYNKHTCHLFISTRKTCPRCTDTKNVFESSEELSKHMDMEHRDDKKSGWVYNGYLCIKCKKKFPKKNLFESHYQEIHSSEIIYTCAWCSRSYSKFASFRSHCYSHIMAGKFPCSYCEKSYTKPSKLSAHVKVVHFGENCSTTTSSSLGSIMSCSPQSTASYLMSPGSETQTNIDLNSLSDYTVDHGDNIQDYSNNYNSTSDVMEDPMSDILCDDMNMTQSDIEDSMNLMLSPSETFSILNSVESINYDSNEFDGDNDSQLTDFINSPESGIDCTNSPFSDFQYSHDYNNDCRDSPESNVHNQSPSELSHEGNESSIQVSCGICWQAFPTRSVLEHHFHTHHKTVNVHYGCVVCNDITESYSAFLSHWYKHGFQKNKMLDSQLPGTNSPGYLDEGLCELGGEIISSYGNFTHGSRNGNPSTNRKRKNDSNEFIKKMKVTSTLNSSQSEQTVCQHCSMAFKDQLYLLQHLEEQHTDNNTFVHDNDASEKIISNSAGERAVNSDWFKTKPLSKYKQDKCIQSVINTSEDFNHSVICYEYNNAIKYNDIVRCNDKFRTKPSQQNSKQTPNQLNLSQIYPSTVQQLDGRSQTQISNDRERFSKAQRQNFDTEKLNNNRNTTKIVPPLWSNSSNVIKGNNSTGDRIMITENDEDLNIVVVNNKKTEDIQSRDIISDQCSQYDSTGKQNTLGYQPFSKSKSAIAYINASQSDNISDKFQNHPESPMQSIQHLVDNQNDCVAWNSSNRSSTLSTLGQAHVLYSDRSVDAMTRDSDHCNTFKQPEKHSPLVLDINIILPTSSVISDTNDLTSNATGSHYTDKVVTIEATRNIASLPNSLVILSNNNNNTNCYNSNELLNNDDFINAKDLNNLREFRDKPIRAPETESLENNAMGKFF